MDFGFFASSDGGNKWLREELVYPSTNIYYSIMVEDVIFRFSWLVGLAIKRVFNIITKKNLSLSLLQFTWLPIEAIACVLQFIEVFRRFVWNFIRLENEHLNNCGQFRIVRYLLLLHPLLPLAILGFIQKLTFVRDISIAPVEMKDQEEILIMMDYPDGAMIVRKRRKEFNKK